MHSPIKNLDLTKYPDGDVTQWFGENPQLYGPRMGMDGHNGIDIVAPWGSPMYAVEDAEVIRVNRNPEGYGKHVRLLSIDHKMGVHREWVYAHCSTIHVSIGDRVRAGEHIADMGNTGFVVSGSTPFWKHNPYAGTHLHLGLRMAKKDPDGWRYEPGAPLIRILDYDNGYKGSVDPVPYLSATPNARKRQMLTIVSLLNTIVALYEQLIEKRRS